MLGKQIFKYTAWFACIYHIVLGVIGLFGTADVISPLIVKIYGVNPVFDHQFVYLVKFISAYFIVFGLTMGILAKNPVKYRALVWVGVALFAIRIFTRLYYFEQLQLAFIGITIQQNLMVLLPISAITTILVLFRPRGDKKEK